MILTGSLAIVTGAASGIGRDLIRELAARGAHVAAVDIDGDRLARAVSRAQKAGPESRITAHVCDVADREAVAELRRSVAEEHRSAAINLLFNNAGVVGGMSFVKSPPEEWERTFAVSWEGTYNCTREFLPMLLASEQGAVVNTASANALWASLGARTPHTAYSSAKFAVRGFTESLIVDFERNAPHLSAVLVLAGHVRTGIPAPPRSWRRAFGGRFADYEPVTSEAAAVTILEAVERGQWRVLIGADAAAVDESVRADPDASYS